MGSIMESVLGSIKKNLGLHEEDTSFDEDIVMHINTVFAILFQMGVGPKDTPFQITGNNETWGDFLNDNFKIVMVKSYVEKKVKLLFDPPVSNAVLESLKLLIAELEWRLYSEENYHNKEE